MFRVYHYAWVCVLQVIPATGYNWGMLDPRMIFAATLIVVAGGIMAIFRMLAPAKPNPPLPERTVVVGMATFQVEIANTTSTRTTGLSSRLSLDEGKGMMFEFPWSSKQGFWMKDMKFPIDIVWIQDNRVVGFVTAPAPELGASVFKLPVYYSPSPVNRVLELPARTVERLGIKEGDEVK